MVYLNSVLTLLFLSSICLCTYGQNYLKHQSKLKHSEEITSIAASDTQFATCSADKSVIVWDYNGKVIYRYKLQDGKIHALAFIADSNFLLVGLKEITKDKTPRYVIKCLDNTGKLNYELIDTLLTQESVNYLFEQNSTGVRNAISVADRTFPVLNVKKDLEIPQVNKGLSHIEIIQSIAVSPDNNTIASIDKFNILKIWDRSQKIQKSFKVTNAKKDTRIFFQSNSSIFIEPNIFLNVADTSVQVVKGFEKFSSIPLNNSIYFHFNYFKESRPEHLFNRETGKSKVFDRETYYTIKTTRSKDKIALLGVNGLIKVINEDGELQSTFGQDRSELITLRGEKINLLSTIKTIELSPNGQYLISGDESGKVIIWKTEHGSF